MPFKHPDRVAQTESTAPPKAKDDADSHNAEMGQQFTDAPTRVTLATGTLDRGEGRIHAVLATDEQASRVLAMVELPAGGLAIEQFIRRGDEYAGPGSSLELQRGDDTCQVLTARVDLLSDSHLVAAATISCAGTTPVAEQDAQDNAAQTDPQPRSSDTPATEPRGEPPQTEPEPQLVRYHWLVTAEDRPRLLEEVQLRPPTGQPTPVISLELHHAQLDDDEHVDIEGVLHLADHRDDSEPTEKLTQDTTKRPALAITFGWLNRPAGLALQEDEPEATLVRIADRASALAESKPDDAEALARSVLSLHDRLCRGAHAKELLLSGQPGVPCGASVGSARAISLLVAIAALRGRLLEAIGLSERLEDPAQQLLPVDRTRAEQAIAGMPELSGYRFTRGPRLTPAATTSVHRPRVAFLDEDRLLLRGTPNRTYSLATGELAPAGIRSGLTMSGPQGRLAVSEIFRDCEGYRARIVNTAQIVNGIVAGPTVATPLLVTQAPPAGHDCERLPRRLRLDASSLTILEYATPGLVFARGADVFVLGLNSRGQATGGAARLVPAGEDFPRSGQPMASANGRRAYPIVTAHGIAIVNGQDVKLLRATEVPRPVSDVALSPSGNRVALTHASQVWTGQMHGAPASTSPSAAGGTPAPRSDPKAYAPKQTDEPRPAPPSVGPDGQIPDGRLPAPRRAAPQ